MCMIKSDNNLLPYFIAMKLSKESHDILEKFFREYYKDENLVLPQTHYFSGRVVGFFTSLFGIYAITFGRIILLAPDTVKRNEKGKHTASGWLIAHEYCHVLQYERKGILRFLFFYLTEYSKNMNAIGKLNQKAHIKAYSDMWQEREAVEVEDAFVKWSSELKF